MADVGKQIKEGRHVGLDIYDLLIEALIDSVRSTTARVLLHPVVAVDMYALSRLEKYRRLSAQRQFAQRTGTFCSFLMADGGWVRNGSEFQAAVGGHGLTPPKSSARLRTRR